MKKNCGESPILTVAEAPVFLIVLLENVLSLPPSNIVTINPGKSDADQSINSKCELLIVLLCDWSAAP